MTIDNFCQMGLKVLEIESAAVLNVAKQLDATFSNACQTILACHGRVIVTGMGKSGHIGHKIAATMASTGTAAFFMHPGEASHGDLGMITSRDVILALSQSGKTAEIVALLPLLKRFNIPLIAITSSPNSPLAQEANIHLNIGVSQEACPFGLTPTASTTAMLAMGDALSIALLEARGFTSEDFARNHPGGTLGRRVFIRMTDVMRTGDALPIVCETLSIRQTIAEMSAKKMGMTAIVDTNGALTGIFTDGDLRRAIETPSIDLDNTPISAVMHANPKTVKPSPLAAEAIQLMETHKITSLIVSEDGKKIDGIIHMHDLLCAGAV